jgi:hypothetical protein
MCWWPQQKQGRTFSILYRGAIKTSEFYVAMSALLTVSSRWMLVPPGSEGWETCLQGLRVSTEVSLPVGNGPSLR